jgi:hypothetical protein
MIDARLPGGEQGSAQKRYAGNFEKRFGTGIGGRPKPYPATGGDDQSMTNVHIPPRVVG